MIAGVRARELIIVNGDRALGSGPPPARFVVVERVVVQERSANRAPRTADAFWRI